MSKKIWIIANEPDMLDIMTYILIDEGYTVGGSTSFAEPDPLFRYQPDLILLDEHCCNPDAIEKIDEFRTKKRGERVPLLLLSAKNDVNEVMKMFNASNVISKPFDLSEFTELINSAIGAGN